MTDLYDQDDEAAALCPVCLQPWGDIQHVMFWREQRVGGVTRPILTCTRQAEMWA